MSSRRSSYLRSKEKQTGIRFTAAVRKIWRWIFLLLLYLSFVNSASLSQLGAATLPNRIAYDFDGNGISDLLWRDTQSGDLAIWLMDGTAKARKTIVFPRVDPSWQIAGVGDLDGDGKADLIWRNTQSGGIAEWLMDGTTLKAWSSLLSGLDQAWQISGVGDLDGDGKADLVWRNTQSGDVAEWLMGGTTIKAWSTVLSGLDLAWQISRVGDLDGDGKADLVWRNTQSGDVAEWLMDGTTIKAWSTLLSGLDQAWQISGVGDLDGDGKADLVWRNMQSGEVVEWLMNGAVLKSWSNISSGVDLAWKIAGVIDLDGDGKSDLIWRNTQSGEVAEWLMSGAALKSWSTIEPGSLWANKPFTPILADHMEVSRFSVDLTAFTFNQRTIYEYLPRLRLTETEGKIGISVSVRLSANNSIFLSPPFVGRVEAGTAQEVLNDEFGGVAFGGNISSITAQISYTDDAGRSGAVSVSAAASDTIYPAVAPTWQIQ
jgi:FG-GAP-like repeat